MTDPELLALLSSKLPEELTGDQLQLLRSRLRESAEIREALLSDLRFEAHFSAAMTDLELSPEKIVAAAEARRRGSRPLALLAFLVIVSALVGLAWYLRQPPRDVPVAQSDVSEKPAEPTKSQDEKPDVAAAPVADMPRPEETPLGQPDAAVSEASEKKNPDTQANTKLAARSPIQPAKPWDDVLEQPAANLPRFHEVCFRGSQWRRKSYLSRADLLPWFGAVPGNPFELYEGEHERKKYGATRGLARVLAPWPVDGGLRFSPAHFKHLLIHVYHGERGVTLLQHRESGRENWEAYATTRKPGTARPATLMHTQGDEERACRSEFRFGGPIEIRWRDGELFLLRGDIALLRAPLVGPPEDIYFDGDVGFEQMELVRTSDFPIANTPAMPAARVFRPADLDWSVWQTKVARPTTKDAKFTTLPDGSVQLEGIPRELMLLAHTPLPGIGPREVIFEVDNASAGFGVYLGDGKGQPHHTGRLVTNKKTRRLCFVLRTPDNALDMDLDVFPRQQEPISAERLWIKLLHGAGQLYAWQSVDGLHWAIADRVEQGPLPSSLTIGLMAVKSDQPVTGRVKSIAVRELPELASLAPRELVERARSLPGEPTMRQWLTKVTADCPAGCDLDQWRRACAIRTLGDGCHRQLGHHLLDSLLDDPCFENLPPEKQRQILRESFQLTSAGVDTGTMRASPIERLLELGRRGKEGHPFSSVRTILMDAPTWSPNKLSIHKSDNAERELLTLLRERKLDEVAELAAIFRFYHFDFDRPLIAWCDWMASRLAGRASEKVRELREDWYPAFTEQLSKEVYNFTADLESLMENQATADAARMITSLESEPAGLTLVAGDADWFVSLQGAAELAIGKHPALREELRKQAEKLADLRIRTAIAAADGDTLRLTTLQFAGTPAVALAHEWLGDRALQTGWFSGAKTEYQAALAVAEPRQQLRYQAKVRLAAAMLGEDAGSPAQQTIPFGDQLLSPESFESLVQEMKQRARTQVTVSSDRSSGAALPVPSTWQISKADRIDGFAGQKPEDDGARNMGQWRIDYAGRQLTTQVDGEQLLVHNRFHLAVYRTNDGRRSWISQNPRGEPRAGQQWPLMPMRPLLTSDRIFVRQLFGPLPCFCCYDRSTGQLVWQQESSEQSGFASDPFLFQGELMIVAQSREAEGWRLSLQRIDALTGDALFEQPLVTLRRSWESRRGCEVALHHETILVCCTGLLMACDGQGNLAWVRKQLTSPANDRPEWVRQSFAPPLICDDRAIILSPGMECVECCDLATGRRLWQFDGAYPWRVIGRAGGQVIVETDDGFSSLDLATGKVMWAHAEPRPRLHAVRMDDRRLIYFTHTPRDDKPVAPVAHWLDVPTGQLAGRSPLPELAHKDVRMGPLFCMKDRWWTAVGYERQPQRELIELTPGDALPKWAGTPRRNTWTSRWPADVLDDCEEYLPDWQLVCGHMDNRPRDAEWYGEKQIISLGARGDLPLVLAREMKFAPDEKSKLQIRWGHDPSQEGELQVTWRGQPLLVKRLRPDSQSQRWLTEEIDLSSLAGEAGVLTIRYHCIAGSDHWLWWKSAIVSPSAGKS